MADRTAKSETLMRWDKESLASFRSRQEIARIKEREAEEARIRAETERDIQRRKNQQWTHTDLQKLVTVQEWILNNNFWDPKTFFDDMTQIEDQLKKEKIELGGVEKEKIQEHGKNFLFWLLLNAHIFESNFYVVVDKDNQPIIHDNNKAETQTPARADQMRWLQAVLTEMEFQHDMKNVLKKNDNIPKAVTYMTAFSYHTQEEKNLIQYREKLENGIRTDTSAITLDSEEIEASNLSTREKSFLLAWRDRKNDTGLLKIEENQNDFVKNAVKNFRTKSPEEHLAELRTRPFGKSVELFWAGLIGATLLGFGLKKLFGKESGTWGRILGAIMTMIGGSIVIPIADRTWQTLGGPDMLDKDPVHKTDAYDNPFSRMEQGVRDIWTKIKNFQSRISGPKEWIELVTRPRLEPAIEEYSVASMLYLLYEWSPSEQEKFKAYKPKNAQSGEIRETFKALITTEEKENFKKLLMTSWERYSELHPEATTNIPLGKTLTLTQMVNEIDTHDSWLNWIGIGPKRGEVFKIIAPNAKEWWSLTIGQIRRYFNPFDEQVTPLDPATNNKIFTLFDGIWWNPWKNVDMLTEYFQSIFTKDGTSINPDMSLREYIKKYKK
jgi:hypothetical protein